MEEQFSYINSSNEQIKDYIQYRQSNDCITYYNINNNTIDQELLSFTSRKETLSALDKAITTLLDIRSRRYFFMSFTDDALNDNINYLLESLINYSVELIKTHKYMVDINKENGLNNMTEAFSQTDRKNVVKDYNTVFELFNKAIIELLDHPNRSPQDRF